MVDFTNARITPTRATPLERTTMALGSGYGPDMSFTNANGNQIANISMTRSTSMLSFVVRYTGSFTASGTEFYIRFANTEYWKIDNITFANGDSFDFTIGGNMVLN